MRAMSLVRQIDWEDVREEHDLRRWSATALWMAGGSVVLAVMLVGGSRLADERRLQMLLAVSVLCVFINPTLLKHLRGRALYRVTNLLAVLGALVVWGTIYLGASRIPPASLSVVYFLPSFYDAYFFRPKDAILHLLFTTCLVLSPLVYASASSLRDTQFVGSSAVVLIGLWGVASFISMRRQRLLAAELKSRREAERDALTGALNLRSLRGEVLDSPLGPGSGLLVVDVDNFKAINSRYGHTGADRLLCAIVEALASGLREEDRIARIGGDEFVILARGYNPSELERLAARCMQAVGGATAAAGFDGPDVACSVGVAGWGLDGAELQELLAAADRRMYEVKQRSKAARGADRGEPSAAPSSRARASRRERAGDAAGAGVAPGRASGVASAESLGGEDSFGHERASQRKQDAMAASSIWLAAAALMALIVLAPGSDHQHIGLDLALIAIGLFSGVALLALAFRYGTTSRLISSIAAFPALSVGIYATGGTHSPLLPALLFVVTFAATFLETRECLLRLGASVAVLTTPFFYVGSAGRIGYLVPYAALVNSTLALAGVLTYCKRELEAAEQSARELALHDPLTGLFNRRAFYGWLERALEDQAQQPLAVAVIDLDNFKELNDRHGHPAGDAALIAMAERLRAAVRPGDCVARIGGDEFAVIAPGVDSGVASALGERLVAAAGLAAGAAGFGDCDVSATVGYALHPPHGRGVDGLIEAADLALMRGKNAGKRQVAVAPPPVVAQA